MSTGTGNPSGRYQVMTNLDRFADARILSFGNVSLTVGGLVTGLIIFLIALLAARLVSRGLRRVRARASSKATAALYLLEKLVGYGIVIIGVVSGLSAAGLNLSSLALFAGAIGIGIGLGLQGVVKEFVSGLFLIFDRMVSVGDLIELDDGVLGPSSRSGLAPPACAPMTTSTSSCPTPS